MSRAFVVAALAAIGVAGSSGAAAAQDTAPRLYGGGTALKLKGGEPEYGGFLVSAAVAEGTRRVSFLVDLGVTCPKSGYFRAEISHIGEIVDGRVRGTGVSDATWDTKHKLRIHYTIDSAVTPAGLDGTLDAVGRRAGKRCKVRTHTKQFAARPVAAHAGNGAPQANGLYFGTVSRDLGPFVAAPFMLQVSADGQRVAGAMWYALGRCRRAGPDPYVNISPSAPIRVDGTFTINEKFSIPYSDAKTTYRVTFKGRFTQQGVAGTLRVRQTVKMKSKRRKGDSCDTGTLRWSGTP